MPGRSKGLSFYRRRKKISAALLKEIFTWAFLMALALLISFVFVYSVGIKTSMIGSSMEPCLYNGQEILINRFLYILSEPKRGDVVVFRPNGNENAHLYIKRVVGVPGDQISIQKGRVMINGLLLEEGSGYDTMEDAGIAENGITLKEDEYFVLGDNRNNSEDSRSANIGPVKKGDIVGKAWFHLKSKEYEMGLIK